MNRDTICVQGGYTPGNGEPRRSPLSRAPHSNMPPRGYGQAVRPGGRRLLLSRLQNPTCDRGAKIAELEGGTAAMLTSSGQAANFFALFNLCEAGDHIVASSSITAAPSTSSPSP